jgi:FemAB-related protein (PEP-CTERM system-associated)
MAVDLSRFTGPSSEWDAFVRAQADWTHFHLYGWRTLIERAFRHECVYLAARDSSTKGLVAVLPMVRVKSLIFGHYLVSMPFVNYGGPLGSEEGVRALAADAARIARDDRVKLLELRSRTASSVELPVSHRKLTVLLDLPTSENALWSALPAKLRSQIKRPRKDGVEVRIGADQVAPFHQVFAHHMRDLGTPALSRSFFQALADIFPDDTRFAVAYHNGQPVACGCGFLWNDEFEITWASALRSHKAMSPNMLVYWDLMREAIRSGARVFNFGRCSPDSGTHRFKMQWGGREQQLWWYQRAANGDASDGASTPSPDKGLFAIATRVWQRLPVQLATRLGPPIVRLIP